MEIKGWLNEVVGYGLRLSACGDPIRSDSEETAEQTRRLESAKWKLLLLETASDRLVTVKDLSAVIGLGGAPKPVTPDEHIAFGRRLVAVGTNRLTTLEEFQEDVAIWFRGQAPP